MIDFNKKPFGSFSQARLNRIRALEVMYGYYGNGEVRRILLGSEYLDVQAVVEEYNSRYGSIPEARKILGKELQHESEVKVND